MIELSRISDDGNETFKLDVGGDTFNTAIYLARLGEHVEYMTAIGDDLYSDRILARARDEGVGVNQILITPDMRPGLYLIDTIKGERHFTYWRDTSPARTLFELPDAERLISEIATSAGLIYLSGVTLSLYSSKGLERLAGALAMARDRGATVAIDSNYRPVGWHGDTIRAQAIFEQFWKLATVALPSFDDEQALWGDATPDDTFRRFERWRIPEVCLKMAALGAIVVTKDDEENSSYPQHVAISQNGFPVDTTAAGDSFSAAYLAARRRGRGPVEAAGTGHRLASIVIQHRGALVPKDATATFTV